MKPFHPNGLIAIRAIHAFISPSIEGAIAMQLEPYSIVFSRALSLVFHHRAGDSDATATVLTEAASDPIRAGATLSALIKLVSTLDNERPADLDEWLKEMLLKLAGDH